MLKDLIDVQAALAYEEVCMGRPCALVDSAVLGGEVTVLVYDVEPTEDARVGDKLLHQRRVVVYVGQDQRSSQIVSSNWREQT